MVSTQCMTLQTEIFLAFPCSSYASSLSSLAQVSDCPWCCPWSCDFRGPSTLDPGGKGVLVDFCLFVLTFN